MRKKTARRYDMADRCRESVSCVYGGDSQIKQDFLKRMKYATAKYYPSPNEYDIHKGTNGLIIPENPYPRKFPG